MDDAASFRHARNFKVEWQRKPCAIILHLESYVTWRWHAVWRVQDPVLQLEPFECSPWTLAPCISSILWAGGVPVPKFSLSPKFFIYLRKASMDIAKFDRDGEKKYRNCWPCSAVQPYYCRIYLKSCAGMFWCVTWKVTRAIFCNPQQGLHGSYLTGSWKHFVLAGRTSHKHLQALPSTSRKG